MYMHCGFIGESKILLEDGYHLVSELSLEKEHKFISKNLRSFKGIIVKYSIVNPVRIHTSNNSNIICPRAMRILSHKEIIPVSNSSGNQIDSIFDPITGGVTVLDLKYIKGIHNGYAIKLNEDFIALENNLSIILDGFIFFTQKNTIEI